MDSTLVSLSDIEKRLSKNPVQGASYQVEMEKLQEPGYTVIIPTEQLNTHLGTFSTTKLSTMGKNRVVFKCSLQYKESNLNQLLPSSTLGPSLMSAPSVVSQAHCGIELHDG